MPQRDESVMGFADATMHNIRYALHTVTITRKTVVKIIVICTAYQTSQEKCYYLFIAIKCSFLVLRYGDKYWIIGNSTT